VADVLITGSQGFIGRSLREFLERRGFNVMGLDVAPGSEARADVLSFVEVEAAFRRLKPSTVIHLAAYSSPSICRESPQVCLSVNVLGTTNVLEASRRVGVERFIYLSSANVYGPRPPVPVSEDSPLAPRTLYDYSKVMAERCVEAYSRIYGLPTVVLRSWKVFGEYDSPDSAVSRFIDACLTGNEIVLYNGGRDVSDPYHVDNLCHALQLVLESDRAVGETFNVGTGNSISVKELAETIARLTGADATFREAPPRSWEEAEPMISYPSIEKARMVLGYSPIVGLEEGLMRQIKYRRRILGR